MGKTIHPSLQGCHFLVQIILTDHQHALLSQLILKGQTVVLVIHEREYVIGYNRIIHIKDGVVPEKEKLN